MTARHSYELIVLEEATTAGAKPTLFPGKWERAEGLHLDAALKEARRIVQASGRIIRSGPTVSSQQRTRANGPTTGKIIIVLHRADRLKSDRGMTESRLKRGLPKEITK